MDTDFLAIDMTSIIDRSISQQHHVKGIAAVLSRWQGVSTKDPGPRHYNIYRRRAKVPQGPVQLKFFGWSQRQQGDGCNMEIPEGAHAAALSQGHRAVLCNVAQVQHLVAQDMVPKSGMCCNLAKFRSTPPQEAVGSPPWIRLRRSIAGLFRPLGWSW